MEEEKQTAEEIALKADKMLSRAGIDIEQNSDEGNLDDVEENENQIVKLHPAITDKNGLPVSMAAQKLPPLNSNLIKLPQSSFLNKNGGPSKMAPMPIGQSPRNPVENQKFSDYIRLEKMRKFKRLPRLVGQRSSVKFICPHCNREGHTATNYEITGTQICCCVSLCWGCCCTLFSCCTPFCCCNMYNVKHSCPKCYYQLGESGK